MSDELPQVWASASVVAQIVNLPYRRLAIGGACAGLKMRTVSGLPIRDTADCQSALQGEAVGDDLREIVALVGTGEGVQKRIREIRAISG